MSIKLTNTFDGKDYYYNIKSAGGTQSVMLNHLDNGRLLISGDNLIITAVKGQNDNLIIIGKQNIIDTNSGDDRIRLGKPHDSKDALYVQSNANKILAGSGNDYISQYGFNSIDAGSGNDKVLLSHISKSDINAGEIIAAEDIYSSISVQEGTYDQAIGWAHQGSYGDCKYLSFLNSLNLYLKKTGKSLSEFVEITKSSGKYQVTFKKSNESVTVPFSDLSDEKCVKGDIDNLILEAAFRRVIADTSLNYGVSYNMDSGNNSIGSGQNSWLISKHIFGIESAAIILCSNETQNDNKTSFMNALSEGLTAVKNGAITNVVVGTGGAPDNNGLIGVIGSATEGHAYCVKDGVVGQYLELVNPWDNNDSFMIDWDDFPRYYASIMFFGDSAEFAYQKEFDNMISVDHSGAYFYSGLSSGNSNTNSRVKLNLFDNISDTVTGYNPFAESNKLNDNITKDIADVSNFIKNAKSIIKNTRNIFESA